MPDSVCKQLHTHEKLVPREFKVDEASEDSAWYVSSLPVSPWICLFFSPCLPLSPSPTLSVSVCLSVCVSPPPRSWVQRTQKLKTQLCSKVLPLKPGVGHYIAMHVTPIARKVFLADFYLPGLFIFIFPKTFPEFFLCQMWLTQVHVRTCRIRYVTLLVVTEERCRFLVLEPAEYK